MKGGYREVPLYTCVKLTCTNAVRHHMPVSVLQLNDMRDKLYLPSSVSVFRGGGHRLGGQRCPSRLLPPASHMHHHLHHGDRCHGDNFLKEQSRTSDTTSELPGKAEFNLCMVCMCVCTYVCASTDRRMLSHVYTVLMMLSHVQRSQFLWTLS